MLEGIPASVYLQGGAFGLLLLLVTLLFLALKNGILIPKISLDKIEAAAEARAKRAEEREDIWRQSADNWRETAHLATQQASDMTEQSRIIIELLNSIRDAQSNGLNHGRRY